MSELSLTIKYNPIWLKRSYMVMCVLFPVWTIALPAVLGLFIGYSIASPGLTSPLVSAVICLALVMLVILFLAATAIADDCKIMLSKDGLSFPLFLLPKLHFRRNRDWRELREINVIETSNGASQNFLVLRFGTDVLHLDLSGMNNKQIEELLLTSELRAPECIRTEETLNLQTKLQSKMLGNDLGYTEIWEEELRRRFHATAFMPLEPDATLQRGKYKILRQLAFGGLSALYLAQENKLDLVVLKEAVVPANASTEARQTSEKHLKRESEMLFCLYHPQIARVMDYFVEDSRHYLVLEHVNGQDLKQFVKQNGSQPEERVVDWAVQIASILQFLHCQLPPITHRDLTPDNLVLKNDGTIVLIDFGAANEFIGTMTGTMVGKQAYIAPEQLRGKTSLQSDLYALGGTIFFLLTGQDPKALTQSFPRSVKTEISQSMDAVVSALTAYDRQDRIATASDALQRLTELKSVDKVSQ